MKRFELKPLVGASLSEQAILEVNNAMNDITDESVKHMSDRCIMAKLALQRHLFDFVGERGPEMDEP